MEILSSCNCIHKKNVINGYNTVETSSHKKIQPCATLSPSTGHLSRSIMRIDHISRPWRSLHLFGSSWGFYMVITPSKLVASWGYERGLIWKLNHRPAGGFPASHVGVPEATLGVVLEMVYNTLNSKGFKEFKVWNIILPK